MSITFNLTREERDWASGYTEPVKRTYVVSVEEAEYIVQTLKEQIPKEKARLGQERIDEILQLRARLKALEEQ